MTFTWHGRLKTLWRPAVAGGRARDLGHHAVQAPDAVPAGRIGRANSIATGVSTGVLALQQTVIFDVLPVALFGMKVAATVGKGIVMTGSSITYVAFNTLIGGIGSAVIAKGLLAAGIWKTVLFALLSSLLGFVLGAGRWRWPWHGPFVACCRSASTTGVAACNPSRPGSIASAAAATMQITGRSSAWARCATWRRSAGVLSAPLSGPGA